MSAIAPKKNDPAHNNRKYVTSGSLFMLAIKVGINSLNASNASTMPAPKSNNLVNRISPL